MRAGKLRNRVTIQSLVTTDDNAGGFTKTWSTLCSAWARKRYVSGGDTPELNQTISRRRVEYTIRRRADVTITDAMRVVDGSNVFDIRAIEADDRDLSAQTLICEEAFT